MANTYSTNLRLILQSTGSNVGTWGTYTNTNIGTLIEEAISGVASVAVSGSTDYTLTASNGVSDEARQAVLNVTGTLTAAINVICPAAEKEYTIINNTTGGYAITLKTASGTGVSIPNGKIALMICDGVNVLSGISYTPDLVVGNGISGGSF